MDHLSTSCLLRSCCPRHAAAAQLARQYPAVRLHTHLAENSQDIEYSLKTYGCRPGGYLE